MSEPRAPRESLTEMLRISERGEGRFTASLESFWGGATPGDLIARATLAATAGEAPSALQATLVRPAPPDVEIDLAREDLSPGRRRIQVSRVQVSRVQVSRGEGDAGGDLLGDVTLRFGPSGDGLTYQSVAPEAGLPAPEDLPSEVEQARAEGWEQYAVGPVETRRIGAYEPVKDDEPAVWLGWLRPRADLPADVGVQAAALSFLAEYRSHWAVERRLGPAFPSTEITVLDFSLWVHRSEPWDDFRLVKTSSDVGVAGRCLSRREIYSRGGALIASAAWEASVRPFGA